MGSIEVEGIESSKVDSLRIKSIASLVKNSTLAVPVKMDDDSIQAVWNAAKGAKHVRLQVEAAVSPSCMEYIQRKKADMLIADAAEAVAKCAQLTDDVEFVAIDATRTDVAYLAKVIDAVVAAGAKTVTVCRTPAGCPCCPRWPTQFIADLYQATPQLKDIDLGISCCNNLNMADACAVAGVMAGASIVKATSYPMGVVALDNVARILTAKADALGAQSKVRVTELKRAMNQISRLAATTAPRLPCSPAPSPRPSRAWCSPPATTRPPSCSTSSAWATAFPTRTPRRCSRPSRRSPPARSA